MEYPEINMFDHRGLIPPYFDDPTGGNRSPYTISLLDFVFRFSVGCARFDKVKRLKIIKGFLEYRRLLHSAGVTSGHQWVNGSFVTYKEIIKNEAPKDIDVLTIIVMPSGESQQSFVAKNKGIFDQINIKQNHLVDAHYLCLESTKVDITSLLERVNYWNNLWSHQRDSLLWKGYFQIDLSPAEDADALDAFNKISKGVENA